jgi:prevent-host-death family protein
MRHVQSSEAKARFSELLDDVERGETIVITRNGRPVAQLTPNEAARQARVEKAIKAILELRKTTGKVTLEELLASRHEGHKY